MISANMAGMNVDWKKPWPLGVLLVGLLMVLLAVIGTFTENSMVSAALRIAPKTPTDYWITLVVQYICAVFLICYWFYAFPH